MLSPPNQAVGVKRSVNTISLGPGKYSINLTLMIAIVMLFSGGYEVVCKIE
jgi:hypothetical protein